MASLIPAGNVAGTGSMTLSAPATNSNQTATLPDATGTVMVSGNMPAFSATLSGNQTISNNTYTKLTLNTKTFDTANCFDSTTNYRFTPNVAGYYQINGIAMFVGTATRQYGYVVLPYKNGSALANTKGTLSLACGTGGDNSISVSSLVYMNGTTDYLELYVYSYDFNATSPISIWAVGTTFNGTLVRAA